MEPETRVYLKRRLKDYYWNNPVEAPSEVHRREFGVGTLDDKIKFRHKSFASEKAMNQFLKIEAPYYISYSAAYYEFPSQPMDGKRWLGADLIFDLDRQIKFLNEADMRSVTEEAARLVDFLLDDFGFQKNDVKVNFSGSKGYHIHVVCDEVKALDADARREIVDYIAGEGLEVDYFLRPIESSAGVKFSKGRNVAVGERWVGPTAESRGWAKRIYAVAEEVLSLPPQELKKIKGVGDKRAQELSQRREEYLGNLRSGRWNALWGNLSSGVKKQIRERAIAVTDEDRQVTADISRLIRLPDTIHGGSGLLAKRVKSLDSFNPLVDAVAFKGDKVRIKATDDVPVFELSGQSWGPYSSGCVSELDESAAVYLMLKGKAEHVA